MAGAAYASQGSAGEYVFSGQMYNNAPVYKRPSSNGGAWSLYKRANGNWHVDFNAISEDWDGTIAYTSKASASPWDVSWSTSTVTEDLFAED